MSWHLTLLLVHLALLAALTVLLRDSPGRIQRLVLGVLILSAAVFVWFHAATLAGARPHWLWLQVGYQLEHIAIFIYVLRLFVIDQERRCLPTSSVRFPS